MMARLLTVAFAFLAAAIGVHLVLALAISITLLTITLLGFQITMVIARDGRPARLARARPA